MAVRDKQLLITDIVATVLGQKPIIDKRFDWFINKHTTDFFKEHFTLIDKIFKSLHGDIEANKSKQTKPLECDAYFGGQYNFMFEFDETQHFGTSRLKTLEFYPDTLKVSFSIDKWKQLCKSNSKIADRYRFNKMTKDFNFQGVRNSQRAYLDCFRDILPQYYGLKPTLCISEFEVININANSKDNCKKIELLIKSRLHP